MKNKGTVLASLVLSLGVVFSSCQISNSTQYAATYSGGTIPTGVYVLYSLQEARAKVFEEISQTDPELLQNSEDIYSINFNGKLIEDLIVERAKTEMQMHVGANKLFEELKLNLTEEQKDFLKQVEDSYEKDEENLKAYGIGKESYISYAENIGTFNLWNFIVSVGSLLIIIFSPRILKHVPVLNKIPGSLYGILAGTVAVLVLKNHFGIEGVDTIGDRFHIQAQLPAMVVPTITFELIQTLMPVAFTIAILGAIESLLSAAVADGAISDKHDSNMELIAQGVANIVTPIFGGIPATGAIARTMTNINNGGRTPVAGIIHAIVLLLILLVLMPFAEYIPMAALAAVLIIVSYNMSGWRTFRGLLKNPKSDVTVLLVTFFLTVIFDLTIAIEIGLIIACALFIKRVMETTEISVIKDEIDPSDEADMSIHEEHLIIPKGCAVYEINGPYFFGIANKFDDLMLNLNSSRRPEVQIIRMRKVPFIDSR